MTDRAPLSREPSRLSTVSIPQSQRSRRVSTESADNVFSDDYGLDSPVTIDDLPLGDVPPPRQHFFDDPFHDRHASTTSLRRAPSPPQLDRSSVAKQRLMIDDAPSSSTGLGRTMSTSSRITIPRADSPYRGPTAPSHPYGMYTQMARSGSIASQSTFRAGSETPFVPRDGPSHPYQMYPQNTVPVGDGEDITTNGFPLGFPRANFSSSNGASNSDVGDIIGADGHVETLPPYSRYADNTVAKGNMDSINRRRSSRRSLRSVAPTHDSEGTTVVAAATAGDSEANLLNRPRELFEEETEAQRARKEGWRETWTDRMKKPTRCGLPLWGLLLIVVTVIGSATIGGIVGGVIGNRQGAQRAYANAATTTTIWLDAIPTTLGPNASPLPTGHYQIPFNQSQEVKQCIPDDQYAQMSPAWGCMDIAYIGVDVFTNDTSNIMMATFEDFSTNTQDFRYGPQPPDFNGSSFTLQPMQDKDAGAWGVAMFFSVLFDKLSILPEDALGVPNEKRTVSDEAIRRSVAAYDGMPLQPSDKPWFCFWNSTVSEFFIYVNVAAPDEEATTTQHDFEKWTAVTSSTAQKTTAAALLESTSVPMMQEVTTAGPIPTQAATTFLAYGPTYPGPTATSAFTKRSYETSQANLSNYPKLIKMVEKRMPADAADQDDYVKPYCQLMQVLDDWSIEAITTMPTICIEEKLYPTSTTTATNNKRALRRDWTERDAVSDLESYCICEWTSY